MGQTLRFSEEARQAWRTAMSLARGQGERFIDTEHLLLAVLEDEGGVASRGLAATGVSATEVRRRLGGLNRARAEREDSPPLSPTPEVLAVQRLAYREAAQLGDPLIGPEHLLLGLSGHRRGLARRILIEGLGLTVSVLRQGVSSARN
jgi:ATP-dependent Clp protease ATP-binding subunit ClpA